ncbi:hypothetical protein RCL_jg12379.t1 [Rhizophagus clarus]|uniref:Uncharacterized protein n=1 Tax=Rhizophagus clarus TaxID=94130 RepID=A0A8H3KYZ9_9GLOM|nr:hypothetical protein RCL_jg12379.t1 [Rhizophagus clarus]
MRSSSPDNNREEYINLISDGPLNILTCEKKNEPEKNIDLEIKQINEKTLIDEPDEEMELKLYMGQSFQTWSDAENFLTEYLLIKDLVSGENKKNHLLKIKLK